MGRFVSEGPEPERFGRDEEDDLLKRDQLERLERKRAGEPTPANPARALLDKVYAEVKAFADAQGLSCVGVSAVSYPTPARFRCSITLPNLHDIAVESEDGGGMVSLTIKVERAAQPPIPVSPPKARHGQFRPDSEKAAQWVSENLVEVYSAAQRLARH